MGAQPNSSVESLFGSQQQPIMVDLLQELRKSKVSPKPSACILQPLFREFDNYFNHYHHCRKKRNGRSINWQRL